MNEFGIAYFVCCTLQLLLDNITSWQLPNQHLDQCMMFRV